mmetsp:Transcript_16437/g.51479  ORF Transcript_16437/g.51479 Transcript_16437/m.51479 type:complete len:360 (-) Transcript_16437:412-1491(-)
MLLLPLGTCATMASQAGALRLKFFSYSALVAPPKPPICVVHKPAPRWDEVRKQSLRRNGQCLLWSIGSCTPHHCACSANAPRPAKVTGSRMLGMTRLAVVTGANKGIGFAIAEQLLPTVSLLIVACRDPARGEATAKRLGDGCVFEELDLSSEASIDAFASRIADKYGAIDVLVNNAAIAFKSADPTPFAEQTTPTLATNFWGTVRLTEALTPLLEAAAKERGAARLVNVASMSGKLSQLAPERRRQFADAGLTLDRLNALVEEFQTQVAAGRHRDAGFGNSNYGMSKLALIAYTKLKARAAPPGLLVNCLCPGYCATDMSSHQGPRTPAEGARNALILATEDCRYNGEFISDFAPATW